MSENIIKCAECGAVLNENSKREFDGLVLCEDCLNNMTTSDIFICCFVYVHLWCLLEELIS